MNFTTTTLTKPTLSLPPSSFNISQKPNNSNSFYMNKKTPTCIFNSTFKNFSYTIKLDKALKLATPRCCFSSSFNLSAKSNALLSQKLKLLTAEFQSLTEPIDRVKRLLNYAAGIQEPSLAERVEVNRVAGCATQVWVEVEMDEFCRMKFKADSDSEITKGFCYCLIWLFDGAEAGDVLRFNVEELGDLNVGVFGFGKVSSRVNGWFHVFDTVQRRTRELVRERRRMRGSFGSRSLAFDEDCCGGCGAEEGGSEVLVSV